MTWFLLKGLLRDRHRSLFPVIIVAGGVLLTVLIYCWVTGVVGDLIATNAKLDTGHVKMMTRAYYELAGQAPNDLALTGVSQLLSNLRRDYPEVDWTARIKFGGLLDIPDENGETRAQGPVVGLAVELLSPGSTEQQRLNLEHALVTGHLPQTSGEIVISDQLARTLGVSMGETATLISATANGSMAVQNFRVAGTVRFGIRALDHNAMLADLGDVQSALDMTDSAGEVLGFLPHLLYDEQTAERIARAFNAQFKPVNDEFAPVMATLRDQNGLGEYLDMVRTWIFYYMLGFVLVMSIVLWNTGLMSGIRRYGEIGVRLALGESKGHIYRSLIYEAVLIGLCGSVLGTLIGLGIAYYLQEHGLNITDMMRSSTILMSTVIRARITPLAYYIGFAPGLFAATLGTMMSGVGIFKRQTAQLFKELEA